TTDSIDQAQPDTDCPLGIVLMRSRVAKIDEHAVAHVSRDKALGLTDDFGDFTVISAHDIAQILGIEPRRERRRADEVAKHHGELPPCGTGMNVSALCCWF